MTKYTPNTDFSAKDGLASGNSAKKILGSEVDAEFDEIQTAIDSHIDEDGGAVTTLGDLTLDGSPVPTTLTGTFTPTWSAAFSSAPAGDWNWQIIQWAGTHGDGGSGSNSQALVILQPQQSSGVQTGTTTGSPTQLTMSAVPDAITTDDGSIAVPCVVVNNGTRSVGVATINNDNTIDFELADGSAFGNTANTGLPLGVCIMYPLAQEI